MKSRETEPNEDNDHSGAAFGAIVIGGAIAGGAYAARDNGDDDDDELDGDVDLEAPDMGDGFGILD